MLCLRSTESPRAAPAGSRGCNAKPTSPSCALAGWPARGPIAAEELAPAAVQPLGCLEQALHLLAGGGRVPQGGLDGPELLDDVLEGVGRRLDRKSTRLN